jgi:hypothetical protein
MGADPLMSSRRGLTPFSGPPAERPGTVKVTGSLSGTRPPTSSAGVKLDLFCRGLRVEDLAAAEASGRPIRRTRAGMASGVALVLPGNVHVNAPVLETWTAETPYSLALSDGEGVLRWNGAEVCVVTRPRRPAFYDAVTRRGVPMQRVAVLQGTYLAAYIGPVCQNWLDAPRRNCKFCSVGLNLSQTEEVEKSVADLVEVAGRARDEEGVTFIHLNTGYQPEHSALDLIEPYVRALRDTGLLIGVQAPPHPDLRRYDALRKLGVNNVSFCLEFWDESELQRICPGKHARSGRQTFLDAIRHCAEMFDTTNGEIIAGLEPTERTIEAIDWITGVGAIPTVCVFRPLAGTDFESMPPPTYAAMKPVFAHLYEACMRRSLPLGIAPNVKVDIVMLPDECRRLSDAPNAFRMQRAKLAAARVVFGAIVRRRLSRARKMNPRISQTAAD